MCSSVLRLVKRRQMKGLESVATHQNLITLVASSIVYKPTFLPYWRSHARGDGGARRGNSDNGDWNIECYLRRINRISSQDNFRNAGSNGHGIVSVRVRVPHDFPFFNFFARQRNRLAPSMVCGDWALPHQTRHCAGEVCRALRESLHSA